jgi:hypothetical protein
MSERRREILCRMLSELMDARHLITAELADEHVAAMSDDEISRRYGCTRKWS